jgi:molecular chaperone DnaK
MKRGEAQIIKSDTLKDTVPSCVAIRKNGSILVGDAAMAVRKNDLSRAMKEMRRGETNTYIEFKRTMGKDTKFQSIFLHKELTSEDLSAEVLKKLKSLAIDEQNLEAIVITHPAKFDALQIEATIRAANIAGFQQVRLLQEPIAAVTAYGLETENNNGYWIVFDFGGGTFDAALIKSEEGLMKVKDTDGDNFLGGKNLDEAIVDLIILPYLKDKYSIDDILNNPEKREILRAGLKRFAEDAKNQMSFRDAYTILTDLGDIPLEDELGEELEIDISITQKDMERVLSPVFQKAIDTTKKLLERNNLTGDKIDTLLLVGGPTHSPILRRMLKEQITEKVDTSVDPMTVVAKGAAIFASTIPIGKSDIGKDKGKQKGNDDGKTVIGDNISVQCISLDIKHAPETQEIEEMVSVKLNREHSDGEIPEELYVELKRADEAWSSGMKQISDTKATIFNVSLLEKKTNVFYVILTDKKANKIDCLPEDIQIRQGTIIPNATLPYHIGIAKHFEDEDEDLFYSVKGLEKNREISSGGIKGVTNGLKTRSGIQQGEAKERLRVPIYQGDYNADGTPLWQNKWVFDVIITGATLPGSLPEGSVMDITIEVDESQHMVCYAYFPVLDHTEKVIIERKTVKPPTNEELEKGIADTKVEAIAENRQDLIGELETLEKQLEYDAGSDDGRLKIQEELIKIRTQITGGDRIERVWKKTKKELEKSLNELEELIQKVEVYIPLMQMMGNAENLNKIDIADYKVRFNEYKNRKEQIEKEKNSVAARDLIKNIGSDIYNIRDILTDGALTRALLESKANHFNIEEWLNPNLAKQLILQGLSIPTPGRYFKIRAVASEVFQLHLGPDIVV